MKTKIVASFELAILMVSFFAFSYEVRASEYLIEKVDLQYDEMYGGRDSLIQSFAKAIFLSLKKPMIPTVSASLEIHSGCCEKAVNGNFCVISEPENCKTAEGFKFLEGALCEQTSFCKKGCCYDSELGIFDKGVLKSMCSRSWTADANCNGLKPAQMGCCVLGSSTVYETYGQCVVDTTTRARGNNEIVNWSAGVSEISCSLISQSTDEGACVFSGKNCKFVIEKDCQKYGGKFNEGYLCTADALNTSCKMTNKTTCVDGRDGVYFEDSCGNVANIYDSSKINDLNYWEKVVKTENSCGANSQTGNANSASCGNCNRILGGICESAPLNKFKVDKGNFYCKATGCNYVDEFGENHTYKNGESWCVYDGKIGDGDDVVGSRHWKYVCNQGEINVEPCADYRNQICIQSKTIDLNNDKIEFSNAACIANNWRECINLNGKDAKKDLTAEAWAKKCGNTLNCQVKNVSVSKYFKFNVCTPKYPGGFDFSDERYQTTASGICGAASLNCTVMKVAKTWGGCEIVANKECLTAKFGQEMNNFCRSLGDCGVEVNVAGKYNLENVVIKKSAKIDSSPEYIESLVRLALPVSGQYAEVEDYSEYLATAGLINGTGNPNGGTESIDILPSMMGLAGIGYAVGAVGGYIGYGLTFEAALMMDWGSSAFAGFGAVAIGVAVGAIAGYYLGGALGLGSGGQMLMAVGGGLVGGGIMVGLMFIPVIGWIIVAIGLVIMAIASLFSSSDCKNIKVKFECKAWQPATGGDDCELCNNDPMKPCSKYRCQSLGAACGLVNVGTANEMCTDVVGDDNTAPIIEPQDGIVVDGGDTEINVEVTQNGIKITGENGECLDAYTPLVFGINTDDLAICKFDLSSKSFEEMEYGFGGNYYKYNHTTMFNLPDPTHGQSMGINWTGDLKLFVKCQNQNGHTTLGDYTIEMCVKAGPDEVGPVIRGTEPENGGLIGFDKRFENITIITNELSTCRWSNDDVGYDSMINNMTCDSELENPSSLMGYVCRAEVPTPNAENVYYIRCKDQPWLIGTADEGLRNENGKFTFILKKPASKISISEILPNEDMEVATDFVDVEFKVLTANGATNHRCAFSLSGYENMIDFYETGNSKMHTQPLQRPIGVTKFYVRCSDETGDFAQNFTEFEVVQDNTNVDIARVWQESGGLKFVTTETSECKFSTTNCRFRWTDGIDGGDGKTHSISAVKGNTYFIKCKDELGNVPADCSLVTRAL